MYKIKITFSAVKIRGEGRIEKLTETLTSNETEATDAAIDVLQQLKKMYPNHAITNIQLSAALDLSSGPEAIF